MANYYDFKVINNNVPIEDVLALHGIQPNSKGWYSIRSEDDTPSAHIDKAKIGNAIHDFGGGVYLNGEVCNTLNPISLTMFLNGVDAVKASQILGEAFGIRPKEGNNRDSDKLNVKEWEEIGIQPDMASKNMDFYPEKFGVEKTRLYAEKFRMPMDKLKIENIRMYEKIIRSRAIPYLIDCRNDYYRGMNKEISLAKAVNSSYDINKVLKDNLSEFEVLAGRLNRKENILSKAIKGTSVKFKSKAHSAEVDFMKIYNGDIAFEIGDRRYTDIKEEAFLNNTSICYSGVSLNEYYILQNNGLSQFPVAAFQKGEDVKLVFLASDASKFNYLIKAMRTREVNISKESAKGLNQSKTSDVGEYQPEYS